MARARMTPSWTKSWLCAWTLQWDYWRRHGVGSTEHPCEGGDVDARRRPVDVDALVAAVVARLHRFGLVSLPPPAEAGAVAAAVVPALPGATAALLLAVKTEDSSGDLFGTLPRPQRLWLEELRQQLHVSAHFGVREREEVGGLLVIGETSCPPPEHQAWYWGRVRDYSSSSPTSAGRPQCVMPAPPTWSGWAFSCCWRSFGRPPHPVGV